MPAACAAPRSPVLHSIGRTPGSVRFPKKGESLVACNKCKCSNSRCLPWNNSYAQVNYSGCNSCNSGCNTCGSYGALNCVSGPFSNCGNWSSRNYPFYTGPCGPCEAWNNGCNCCCGNGCPCGGCGCHHHCHHCHHCHSCACSDCAQTTVANASDTGACATSARESCDVKPLVPTRCGCSD